MSMSCSKCGGQMDEGVTTAALMGSRVSYAEGPKLMFIVSGTPISPNPVKAFMQGLADEPSDQIFPIRGFRCSKCGLLELYAT